MNLARYRKALVALVGALAVVAAELPEDSPSWLAVAASVVTALAVYLVPNKPSPDLSRIEQVLPAPPRPPGRPLE